VTPPNFHFVSLNQGIVLPAQGINLRCHVTKAKALCVDDGFDPAQNVPHVYGDDFTALEWESWWTSDPAIPFQSVVSPMWRLSRARRS
jgi:hypothetical protein